MEDDSNAMPVKEVGVRVLGGGIAYELLVTDFDWDDRLVIHLVTRSKDGPPVEFPPLFVRWQHARMSRVLHDHNTGSGQYLFDKEALKRALESKEAHGQG